MLRSVAGSYKAISEPGGPVPNAPKPFSRGQQGKQSLVGV